MIIRCSCLPSSFAYHKGEIIPLMVCVPTYRFVFAGGSTDPELALSISH